MTVIPSEGSSKGPEFEVWSLLATWGHCSGVVRTLTGRVLAEGTEPVSVLSLSAYRVLDFFLFFAFLPSCQEVTTFVPTRLLTCSASSPATSYDSQLTTYCEPTQTIRNWFCHRSRNMTTSSLPSLCYAASHSPSAGACCGSGVIRRTHIHSKIWALCMNWLDFYKISL